MNHDFVILGGGMAGLTAAFELLKRGQQVTLIEKSAEVGGLARTIVHSGFRFDIGGHRFHSNNPAVVQWVRELLGDDLLTVPRQSHIYLNGRFVTYPLQFPSAVTHFSLPKAAHMSSSYLLAKLSRAQRPDRSFEDWVVNRFGWEMYRHFFQPYTEKVWGIPPSQLSAEWAATRIGLPSLWQALRYAIWPSAETPATAVTQFYYPRHGFGQIPAALKRQIIALGGTLHTATTPLEITPTNNRFDVTYQLPTGETQTIQTADLISTIPLHALGSLLQPAQPQHSLLAYRGLICVFLALDKAQVSQDSWTYFPDQAFTFGRTHEPKNWSPYMVPDPAMTSLALEIFTDAHSPLWHQPDAAISQQVVSELANLGWLREEQLAQSWVMRIPHAYPIYKVGYERELTAVKQTLYRWPNLHLLGRTGSFRYLNSDGVIENVFQFLERRFGEKIDYEAVALMENGRWV